MQGDPVAIEAARTALEETWAKVDGIKKDLGDAVAEVGGFWTGSAAALYGKVHQDYKENVEKLTNALTALADTLGDVALQSRVDIQNREDVIQGLQRMTQSVE
ncbi:MAG: WXG100 family type VII secretion target [Micrococcales bacterium]|nr:WXG100 family type VII secretion target [Micrococcales bacterium]